MKNSLSKAQLLFQSSCRIKILYQISEKAVDKCEDLAKYICVKNSVRNLRFLTFFLPSLQFFFAHSDLSGL